MVAKTGNGKGTRRYQLLSEVIFRFHSFYVSTETSEKGDGLKMKRGVKAESKTPGQKATLERAKDISRLSGTMKEKQNDAHKNTPTG